jgi:serine/threonine protein kinase/tetratricopeptide (TPR) repeat protein
VLERSIGSYRLLEKLGAGGMGEVYRAADSRLNRQVALKILSSEHARRQQSLERFRREACAVAALNHPNIVTIYSVEEHQGLHFLTMELVHGRTLGSLIPPEGLPLLRLLEIAVPLAEALEAAHERGIVHRDLKPENVMVSQEGRVKVLDFGIAKSESDGGATLVEGAATQAATLTETGLIIGTPSYMSPEQALGHSVDHRTDLFSFGVLLYEMSTGSRPFRGSSASETVAALLRDDPPRPSTINPHIPQALDNLITSCLEKDVSRRVQSARELRQGLQALPVNLSVPALTLPADTGRLTQLRRRWRTPVAAFALTGCLALTLTATRPRLVHVGKAGNPASPRPGLAVLPLGNFSQDPEYFVDGMTDSLIASLSDIQGVRVISRQSVMRYKGSSEPLPTIARELGVDVVVQGSVMREGNRVRITAQLIRAEPEQQIWAQSYERDLSDVLSLQKEVARAISQEIQVKLEPADQRRLAATRPVNPEAYDAYLKGRHAWYQRTSAGFESALGFFRKALDLDPKLALAHAGLADVHSLIAFFGPVLPSEALAQARMEAQAALTLDPDLGDAHVSLGFVQLFADRDWIRSEASFRRAIALNPSNPMAHQFYSLLLLAQGRRQEGNEQIQLVYDLDPLSPSANNNMGVKAFFENRPDEALRRFQKAHTLAPEFPAPYFKMSELYRRQGKEKLAYESFRKALTLRYAEIAPEVDRAYRKGGRKLALEAAVTSLETLSRSKAVPPEDLARVYVRLGESEKALDCLEASYRRGYPGALMVGAYPEWDWSSLLPHPRFQSLVERLRTTADAGGSQAQGEPAHPSGCRSAR